MRRVCSAPTTYCSKSTNSATTTSPATQVRLGHRVDPVCVGVRKIQTTASPERHRVREISEARSVYLFFFAYMSATVVTALYRLTSRFLSGSLVISIGKAL